MHYSKSYLEMDSLLEAHSNLGPYLWRLAKEGVSDADFHPVLDRLPDDFKELVLDGKYYDNEPYSLSRLPPSTLSVGVPPIYQEKISAVQQKQHKRKLRTRLRGVLRKVVG